MKKSASFGVISTFLSAIVIGALLLMLPFANNGPAPKIEDALFTSASAVTVTGLIVKDTAKDFTLFGQLVILILLQFGGLGFMTLSTLVILLMGRAISFKERYIIENEFTTGRYKDIKDLVKKIFLMTFALELLGAVSLYFQFGGLGFGKRVFAAVFHSISAFCNAGFSVFSNSFENYTTHIGVNLTLVLLIIMGGIGFLVLSEILLFLRGKIKSFSRFSLHTKLVLIASAVLIVFGFMVIFVQELLNRGSSLPVGGKALVALFQSVTARTAGFNTVNMNLLSVGSLFVLIVLMAVGACPGSTGGGIKTSSLSIVFAYLRSRLRGREKVDLFYRNIPAATIEKAFTVIILAFLLIAVSLFLLVTFEDRFKMRELLFETVSAFGTVGLSMGITAKLSLPAKIIIMVTMFIGRIGPLTLMVALSKRESKAVYDYPEENIMIG